MSPIMGCQETKEKRGETSQSIGITSTSGEVPLAPFVVLEKKGEKEDGIAEDREQEAWIRKKGDATCEAR
jgi:hypothetical protein